MSGPVVIALGGNAIQKNNKERDAESQMRNVRITARYLAEIIERGVDIVITHGNGPQVGDILLRNEISAKMVPSMPLDVCGAESQGMIGYWIQQALQNELRKRGIKKPVATVVTQVLVDPNDPAFQNPTKFIGPTYTEEEAKKLMEKGYTMKYDIGRKGWRRVVPSPDPKEIIEIDAIKSLVESGTIVIAVGGGGIPVIRTEDGDLRGVEAVIDKDLATERLATQLRAEKMLILTAVEKVYLNFGRSDAKSIDVMTVSEAEKYYSEGHFPPGSMGPKVLASIRFVKHTGNIAIISSLEKALEAFEGRTGTKIVPG
ncbi:MAG: carbamate kinase [Euryarchaeota archaeon]|nr:carbamate kinase [Euryarchaeota archaeon]